MLEKYEKEYYRREYTNIFRFMSYFYQIKIVQQYNQKEVLEIGIGDKTTSNYLKNHGIRVTTCDIDKNLEPDYVCDIKKLPFADNSFDGVLIFEILEHMPWEDLDSVLSELDRVTREYIFLSVPYFSFAISMALKIPKFNKLLNFTLRIPMPFPFLKTKIPNEHYWEIGRTGYPLKRFKNVLSKKFEIINHFSPPLVPSHCFFILRKK